MRRFFTAFALTLLVVSRLAVFSAAAESQPQGLVLLKTKVVVEGPVLHLGDLFEGLGEKDAIPVARAPGPGKRVQVDARWLAAVAQAYGVPWRRHEQNFDAWVAVSNLLRQVRTTQAPRKHHIGQQEVDAWGYLQRRQGLRAVACLQDIVTEALKE